MTTPPPPPPIYSIPIPSRPRPGVFGQLRKLAFNATFFTSCILIHLFQLLFCLPFYPLPFTRGIYRRGISFSKEAFAALLVLVTALFGGAVELVVTAGEGVDLDELVKRGQDGQVGGFNFAKNSIWTANHQQYSDWIYLWILMFKGGISEGLCIILKASLEWTPVLGPAMQMFQFAFVSKTKPLVRPTGGIYAVAKQSLEDNKPFSLLLFPEGTLVSRLTRPKSAAFAQATGVPDLTNMLLPRSTGLLYSLRTLRTVFPSDSLTFYDLTVGYPGIPPAGYAQDYFGLQSVYGLGQAPPQIHLHLRKIDLEKEKVPIGKLSYGSIQGSKEFNPKLLDEELSVEERNAFQEWTRNELGIKKDELMSSFYRDGKFPRREESQVVKIKVELKLDEAKYLVVPALVIGILVGVAVVTGCVF